MKQIKKWMTLFTMLMLASCSSNVNSSILPSTSSILSPSSSSSSTSLPTSTITPSTSSSEVPTPSTSSSSLPSTSSEAPKVEHAIVLEETEHGSVLVSKETAYEGEEIYVEVTPEADYELGSLLIQIENEELPFTKEENVYTFTMPDADVKITANFVLITSFKVDFYDPETIDNGEFIGEPATVENITPYFPEGILTDVSDIVRVGVKKRGGLGLGSGSAYGGLKFILNERYRIQGISINAVNWSNVDGGILVNGRTPDYGELEGVSLEYNTNSIVRWEFAEDVSTNEVYIHTPGVENQFRVIIYSITFHFAFDTKYDIQVGTLENGMIEVPSKAYENNVVSFKVEPSAHYALDTLEVKHEEETIEVNENTFVMPKGNVTILATFVEVPTYDVILSTEIDETKGKMSVEKTEYFEGDEVTIDVIEAPGYQFKELVVTPENTETLVEITGKTFIMPKESVTVNVIFEAIPGTYTASFYTPETMSDMKGNGHAPTLAEMQALFPEGKVVSTSNSRAGYGKRGGMGLGSGSAKGKLVLNFSEDFLFDQVDVVAVKWAANDGSLLVNGLEPTTGTLSGASTETTYDCEKVVSYQLGEVTNSLTLSTAGVAGQYRCIIFAVTFHLVEQ